MNIQKKNFVCAIYLISLNVYVQIYRNLRRNPKYAFEFFFRVHLPGQVFLIVCSIHKRNLLLYNAYRMVYFF